MTLHQLKVFVTVVKLSSFTEAAKALHTSQPSVSSLVQDLQEELGVKLFERLGNRRQLTEAGKRLLQRAEDALKIIEGIREEIDELKGLKKGHITIGASFATAATFLPQVVQAFRKEYPSVEVDLKIQRSVALEKNLLDGDIHLALMGRPPQSPILLAEPYFDDEVVFIASPNHSLAKKRLVSLELLSKETFIVNEKGTPIRDMIEQAFAKRGLPLRVGLEIDVQLGSRDAIKNAVAAGLGVSSSFECHVASDIKAGRLKVLKVPELKLKRTGYIVIHKNRQDFAPAQEFINLLRRYKGSPRG